MYLVALLIHSAKLYGFDTGFPISGTQGEEFQARLCNSAREYNVISLSRVPSVQ